MDEKHDDVTAKRLRAYLIIVAIASFATTFPQQRMLGHLPTLFLLKDQMHLGKEQVAEFFMWATFAWSVKPIAGVLIDAFPLMGTRRKHYLLLGSAGATASWVGLGLLHDDYGSLLILSVLLNIFMVFASTAMGGIQVEAGQAFSAPGRVTSLRQIFSSIAQFSAPALGGWLSTQAFGLTAGIAAATLLALAIATAFVLQEPPLVPAEPVSDEAYAKPTYRPTPGVLAGIGALALVGAYFVSEEDFRNLGYSVLALLVVFLTIVGMAVVRTRNAVIYRAQGQLTQILASRTLWLAVVMLFLIYTVPGLYTALTYRQTDELKFDKELIGGLQSWEAAWGLGAAFIYGAVCKRFTLRTLLVGTVLLNALVTLGYMVYSRDTAYIVQAGSGLMGVGAELALMDLAVRSTPKGCEALGFALMMSVRNFGIAMSDVIGTKMIDQFAFTFPTLVLINAATTATVLLFTPFLPRIVMLRRDGDAA